jgi:hypothetical protein
MDKYELDLEELLEQTESKLKQAERSKIEYFTVLDEAARELGIPDFHNIPAEIRKLKGQCLK